MVSAWTIVLWCLHGGIGAAWASSRGRSPLKWFFVGFVLGWIGLLALFLLPPVPRAELETGREPTARAALSMPVATTGWFYVDRMRAVCGPCSVDELLGLWKAGLVTAESWVWNGSIVEWKKISQEAALLDWFRERGATPS